MRELLFDAYWTAGENLSDPSTLERLGATRFDDAIAAHWREEWLATPRPIVPVMVLADGHVSRGLGALTRLLDLITAGGRPLPPPAIDPADLGGEPPCFAHLL